MSNEGSKKAENVKMEMFIDFFSMRCGRVYNQEREEHPDQINTVQMRESHGKKLGLLPSGLPKKIHFNTSLIIWSPQKAHNEIKSIWTGSIPASHDDGVLLI